MNQIKRELMIELKGIYNNRDFVCGAICNAGSEVAWLDMLEYIRLARQKGRALLSDDLLILSVALGEKYSAQADMTSQHRQMVAVY